MSEEDIWKYVGRGSYAKYSKWRDMEKVRQPQFESPTTVSQHARGNTECLEVCKVKHLPRNAILVDSTYPLKTYESLVKHWRQGHLGFLAHGSCQLAITKGVLKAPYSEVKTLLRDAKLKCIDNIDNTTLKKGNILLTRVGSERSVGKPHLILKGL